MSTSIEKVETGSSAATLTGLAGSLAKASVLGRRGTATSGRDREDGAKLETRVGSDATVIALASTALSDVPAASRFARSMSAIVRCICLRSSPALSRW